MSKIFVVDINRCNGCHACQVVCKDEHCGQSWLPVAEAQPLTGQFWCRVDYRERGQVPWVRVSHVPVLCNHCASAPCAAAAVAAGKPEAIYTRDDGLVIINPVAAKGIADLAKSCPIGAIYYNAELDLAQKCTGCAHLLDNGWEVPRCVDACPTDALLYVEQDETDLEGTIQAQELEGKGSRVYYRNYPKRFVAGTVVDMMANEVIIGAQVSLLDTDGNAVAILKTDEFGDYKFDQVDAKKYSIKIICGGYQDVSAAADLSEIDLSLGDIDLSPYLTDAQEAFKFTAQTASNRPALDFKPPTAEEMAAKAEAAVANKQQVTALICPACGKKTVAERVEDVTRCQFCKESFTEYTLEELGASKAVQ